MDKSSKPKFIQKLESYEKEGTLPEKIVKNLVSFFESYSNALNHSPHSKETHPELIFSTLAELIIKQMENPYEILPYHERVRTPFDYYKFGLDFLRPLMDESTSKLVGKEHLKEIEEHLKKKHNVIFLANHQIEADPQAISLLLEKDFPALGENTIFVAGERVTTDPLAIPFSLGRNLLCIYSKRYIDHPPELKHQKQLHNKKTMELMSTLLSEGGKSIYVAPSGGRDRRNTQGKITIAEFDPQSIEMLFLMAKKAKQPTFFYPMALSTYELLPPPETIQIELGEKRSTQRGGIRLAVGKQIDMEHFPGCENPDKHQRRKCRADYIWNLVDQDYKRITDE